MAKKTKNLQTRIRQRYQGKRAGQDYSSERKRRLEKWKSGSPFTKALPHNYEITNLAAPDNFSLLENTDEVLAYIRKGRYFLKQRNPIRFDISEISNLTPEVIPLLISHLNDPSFGNSMPIHGNAPNNEKFKKIFTESGFYKHVRSKTKFETSKNNIMHRESNFKVMPDIAGDSVELILNNGNYDDSSIEPIYNIFIELMSNTHHHANLKSYGSSKWWLYVFVDNENKKTSISFLDLGVGIFKSVVVKNYLKKIGRDLKLVDNSTLVKDLLNGKIQSRIEIDNEIRGKGIPQIVEYSKYDCFDSFYLITNDMKIDMKNGTWKKLKENLKGTFYFIQLNH